MHTPSFDVNIFGWKSAHYMWVFTVKLLPLHICDAFSRKAEQVHFISVKAERKGRCGGGGV